MTSDPIRPDTADLVAAEGAQGNGHSGVDEDRRKWLVLAAVCVAAFMVVLDIAIVNVALPSMATDLQFQPQNLQWVITAYAIFFGGFLLLGGRLADLLGRRRVFMFGVGLFSLASLLCGLAWNQGSLIAFRALQGLGGAILSPAALAVLTTTFTEGRERNRALGIWGAVAGTGAAAGTLLGGVLTSGLDWSWIFFVNVPVGVAIVAVMPLLIRESRAQAAIRHFDVAGAVTVTAGLMMLVYALTRAIEVGWASFQTIGVLALSAGLLAAFVAIEFRSRAPLLPLSIFRRRSIRGANVVGALIGAAVFSQFFLLSLYMQNVLQFSAMETGLAYIASTFSVIAFAPVAQSLVTRFGPGRVLPIGLTFAAAALLYYLRLPVDGSYVIDLMPGFIVGGIALAHSFIPVSIAALTGVRPHEAGIASGLINTSQQIGGAIGLAVASTVAATVTAGQASLTVQASPAALTAGYHAAFFVLVGIALVGAVLSATLLDRRLPSVETEALERVPVEV
jgi:EmrB/QacA subfamily drug resistance transporter